MTTTVPAATTYLSRHETFVTGSNNGQLKGSLEESTADESEDPEVHMASAETASHASSGSQYLQEVLGDVLAEALSQVAKERPTDPIQYVADYLHGLKPVAEQQHHHGSSQINNNNGMILESSRSPSPQDRQDSSPSPEYDDEPTQPTEDYATENGHESRYKSHETEKVIFKCTHLVTLKRVKSLLPVMEDQPIFLV
jgi:hypothetical protein